MFFKAILKSVWNWKILSIDFAQFSTMKRWECIDAAGDPIPWYTYPASEYLKQLDFSDKRVLEYGSGYSTIFWSRRAKHVVSIEDSPGWYEKIKPLLPGNVTYRL